MVEVDVNDESSFIRDNLVRVPAPNSIALKLLPYQEEGYGWNWVLQFHLLGLDSDDESSERI